MTVGLYNGQETGPSKVIRVKYGNASFCTNLIKHEWCLVLKIQGIKAHPTNPVEGCADANPKTELPNDT